MITGTIEATREDLNKVMKLLNEYTDKLRAICEEHEVSRFRRLQMMSMSMIVLMSVVASSMLFALRDHGPFSSFTLPLLVLVVGVTASSFFFLTTTMTSRRFRYSFQAKQIALTVQKLISLASQYSEHSASKISDKFEFDLRVAEAEAALHMYEEVFNRRESPERSK
ncbi:MAG: hypothetical protein DM484_15315 [Candidatus Methylumidiphilus alinenensis]|uniref:DUF4231 domain-containing protein n=1 Tax=Candidatus Methylumidiphilus alinenensis TaxID=2202197 RepID=A0A2W4R1S4_9GAMM|nr:MAG: hypothetical protein DM484_15315 [Candidatus Methylumidiphilus alinenensis]